MCLIRYRRLKTLGIEWEYIENTCWEYIEVYTKKEMGGVEV